MAKLIFNNEPKQLPTINNELKYRVDARTRNEPKRIWPKTPTYKTWLGDRRDDHFSREGFKAWKRENLSQEQQDAFYKLVDRCHALLKQRIELDHQYGKALQALKSFGPVPPKFELEISQKVRDALRHTK
jgi:hypothetical protein